MVELKYKLPQDDNLRKIEELYIINKEENLKKLVENPKIYFIRRIMGIQTGLVIFFTLFVAIVYISESLRKKLYDNYWIIYIALAIYGLIFSTLLCFGNFIRTAPASYITLFLLVSALSIIAGVLASLFDRYLTLSAMIIATAITIGLTIYSFLPNSNYSYGIGIMIVVLIATAFTLIMMLAVNGNKTSLFFLYCWLCEIAYGIYLIVDITWSSESNLYNDNYIYRALFIYVDYIIMAFMLAMVILLK